MRKPQPRYLNRAISLLPPWRDPEVQRLLVKHTLSPDIPKTVAGRKMGWIAYRLLGGRVITSQGDT